MAICSLSSSVICPYSRMATPHWFLQPNAITVMGGVALHSWIRPALSLVYFQYWHFLLQDVFGLYNSVGKATFSLLEKTLLPAGISFFTFQLIAFAIDRYRGLKDRPDGLLQFGFYISFFPQLNCGSNFTVHRSFIWDSTDYDIFAQKGWYDFRSTFVYLRIISKSTSGGFDLEICGSFFNWPSIRWQIVTTFRHIWI